VITAIAATIMITCKRLVPAPRPQAAMVQCFDDEVNKLKFDSKGNVVKK